MKVKIWGCRGSLPTPLPPQYLKEHLVRLLSAYKDKAHLSPEEFIQSLHPHKTYGYGGHTACIEVQGKKDTLIIDGGSGIRLLGQQLMTGPCGQGQGEVHILFTHFHWDHIIGLPFFVPLFKPGNKIHVYAVQLELKKAFQHIFQKPFFPVPFEVIEPQLHFHLLEPRKPFSFQNLTITPYQLDHPDPCWGYRIEEDGKVFSHCVDTEGTRVSREKLGPDLPLYQNVDLLFFDAQYTFKEASERINWGHSSAPIGLDIALREGVKRIYFLHHDPFASNEKIYDAEMQTQEYYETLLENSPEPKKIEWGFAVEGQTFEV